MFVLGRYEGCLDRTNIHGRCPPLVDCSADTRDRPGDRFHALETVDYLKFVVSSQSGAWLRRSLTARRPGAGAAGHEPGLPAPIDDPRSKSRAAIILVHGYTNCPQQFKALGQRFYDMGYNVLIAPLPHHGLADRMTEEHGLLTAEELAAYADETVDLAQGLGDQADARNTPPAAKKTIKVINPTDESVDNGRNMQVVKNWQAQHANLDMYEFDANLQLPHDLIDPTQPYQQIEIVYPQLIDLVNR
jgi:hypothetical protein